MFGFLKGSNYELRRFSVSCLLFSVYCFHFQFSIFSFQLKKSPFSVFNYFMGKLCEFILSFHIFVSKLSRL